MRFALAAALLLASATAHAAVIDFEADTIGFKPNGFVSASGAGVSFTDTNKPLLRLADYDPLSIGKGLQSRTGALGRLRMDFTSHASELSLVFGIEYDGFSPGDRAWLALYNDAALVGTVSVEFTDSGVADQTIGFSGAAFNNALFWYGDATGASIATWEIIDNVTFNTVETPEPASLALLGAGLLGLAGLHRRR